MNFAGDKHGNCYLFEQNRKTPQILITILTINDTQDPFTNSYARFQNLAPDQWTANQCIASELLAIMQEHTKVPSARCK